VKQWCAEFSKFAPQIRVSTDVQKIDYNSDSNEIYVHIDSHSKLNSKNADIEHNKFSPHSWDRIVIDEAHVIRNKKSKIHKACCHLKSEIRWALSATPVMNKMTDFVNTLQWIGVTQVICQNFTKEVVDYFTKRRTKEDISVENKSLELPLCHVENIKLTFQSSLETNLYVHVYKECREQILAMEKSEYKKNAIYALELLLRVRQLCCHPASFLDGMKKKYKGDKYNIEDTTSTKLESILVDISSVPDEDKCLIFCHFIKEMDAYCERLKKDGYEIARLDGSMDSDTRQSYVNKFNTNPKCKVMVVQINTGGVGYNFQVANRIYITAPTWNPSLQHQVIGRSHRTGQEKEVFVKIYSIHSGKQGDVYVEDFIIDLQKTKLKMISDILGDPRIDTSGKKETTISFDNVCKMFRKAI
jgi:SNF2 family DNA or RNA helicase